MNSSLRRFCNSRARLLHRSKDLERVVLKMEDGTEVDTGLLRVSKVRGLTFNAGIHKLKRALSGSDRPLDAKDLRSLKERVWHGAID